MGIYKRIYKREDSQGKNKTSWSWYFDFYYNGQRYTECIGQVSKTVAKEILATKKAEVIKGEYIPKKEKADIVFEKMAEQYMEYYKADRKFRSWRRHKVSFKSLFRFFGGKKLSEIHPFMIEKYKKARLEEERSNATINRELACLKNMFNKAIEWGKFAGDNPVKKIKFYKEDNGRIRFLTDEEEERLLSNCPPQLKPLVITALHTGFRLSELLSLTWDNVDFKNRLITVEAAYSKNGEARKTPMNNVLTETLKAVKRENPDNPWVFTTKGRQYLYPRRAFGTTLRRACIKDFVFHDLRHTFASRLVMAGVDLPTVKELMGHKTITMTLRYAHLSADHKKQAVALLEKTCSKVTTIFTTEAKPPFKNISAPVAQ